MPRGGRLPATVTGDDLGLPSRSHSNAFTIHSAFPSSSYNKQRESDACETPAYEMYKTNSPKTLGVDASSASTRKAAVLFTTPNGDGEVSLSRRSRRHFTDEASRSQAAARVKSTTDSRLALWLSEQTRAAADCEIGRTLKPDFVQTSPGERQAHATTHSSVSYRASDDLTNALPSRRRLSRIDLGNHYRLSDRRREGFTRKPFEFILEEEGDPDPKSFIQPTTRRAAHTTASLLQRRPFNKADEVLMAKMRSSRTFEVEASSNIASSSRLSYDASCDELKAKQSSLLHFYDDQSAAKSSPASSSSSAAARFRYEDPGGLGSVQRGETLATLTNYASKLSVADTTTPAATPLRAHEPKSRFRFLDSDISTTSTSGNPTGICPTTSVHDELVDQLDGELDELIDISI